MLAKSALPGTNLMSLSALVLFFNNYTPQVEPQAVDDAAGRGEMADEQQSTARSITDEGVAFVELAAAMATAPVFAALASIPGWFSEAVFEVRVVDGIHVILVVVCLYSSCSYFPDTCGRSENS